MTTFVLLQAVLIYLPLAFNAVEGFSPVSSISTHTVMNDKLFSHSRCEYSKTTNRSVFQRTSRSILVMSASADDNAEGGSDVNPDKAAAVDVDNDEIDNYDFEAGFKARLQQEGGRTGVQVKAAQRSVKDASGSFQSNVKKSTNSLSLLSSSQWLLTVGVLALVVVLAVTTHVTGTSTEAFEPVFGSTEPFETTSNGDQLGFGGR
jgi:hypothetical protein